MIHHPADAAHIADRKGPELLAYGMDQEFDGVALDFLVPSVDVTFEVAAGEDGAGAREQRLKHGEFARRKEGGLAEEGGFPGRGIEADFSVAEQCGRTAAFTPEHGAHPRQQFAYLEGFYQIIIRAEIQAVDTVFYAVARGHDDHRKPAADPAEPAQNLLAIGLRQYKIEQRHVVALGF